MNPKQMVLTGMILKLLQVFITLTAYSNLTFCIFKSLLQILKSLLQNYGHWNKSM